MANLEHYECEGQMDIFDYLNKPEYIPTINAKEGRCEFDPEAFCNRYGKGYEKHKPKEHWQCTGCCRYCDAYHRTCTWERKVKEGGAECRNH